MAANLICRDEGSATAKRTQLFLFNPYVEQRGPLAAAVGGLGGWNPRITVSGEAWHSGPNFVLVGKMTRSSAANSGVETRVDLVRGPLNSDFREAALGVWRELDVGRYYAWVYAKTPTPIGDTSSDWNSAKNMPTEWACPDEPRGRLDRWAFNMRVERQTATGGALVTSRRVRLAQMGAAKNDHNLLLIAFEVAQAGWYRVTAAAEDSNVAFFANWRAYRNPDASELTVASYNTLYDIADLLSTQPGNNPQGCIPVPLQPNVCRYEHNHRNKTGRTIRAPIRPIRGGCRPAAARTPKEPAAPSATMPSC